MQFIQRPANISDQNFIASLILSGSRKHHFTVDTENPDAVREMKQHLQHAIQFQRLKTGLASRLETYTTSDGQRAGFVMLIEAPESPDTIEIYAIAVLSSYRGHGLGSLMLDNVISQYYRQNLIARCSSQSQPMRHLLTRKGFLAVDHSARGDTLFARSVPEQDMLRTYLPGSQLESTL